MRAGEKTSSHVDLSQRWREGRGGNEQREMKRDKSGRGTESENRQVKNGSGTDKSRGADGGERRGERRTKKVEIDEKEESDRPRKFGSGKKRKRRRVRNLLHPCVGAHIHRVHVGLTC